MSNFKNVLEDILFEKGLKFKDLEDAGLISKRSFYQFKDNTPYLNTIIKIANYLHVSLDYIALRTDINKFRSYNINQLQFYEHLINIMKEQHVTQSQISQDLNLGRSNFTHWKHGKLPKLSTLIILANYLTCSIDDFFV